MSETNQPVDTNPTIEEKLHAAWRHERRFCNLRGLSRFLIWVVALVALDFLIDWGILANSGAPAKVGLLLPILNVVVLSWVVWREWVRHLRKYDALRVALEIEAQHSELASRLASYTQLEATLANQPNVSRELVEAMRIEAIEQTRPLNFREIVDFGQLRSLLLVSVASIAVFAVLSFSWQEHFRTLMQRLVGVEVRYPTQTQIASLSEDLIVRFGDSVIVRADANPAGVLPPDGEIYLRPADSEEDWKQLPLRRSPNGTTYSRKLEELTRDLEYHVRLADDRSADFRIRVIQAPRVTAARLTLKYPKYMGMPDGQTDQFNIEVPENTEIRWQLTCAPAVKRLEIRHEDETLEATLDPTGRQATFSLKADRAFKYTFHWMERDSGKDFEYDDVQHSVRVVADKVPEVELLRPARSGLATVRKTLELMARAGDDHGLSTAWLVYSLDGSEEKRLPIYKFGGVKRQEFKFSWKLAGSIEGLKPGMRVVFAVEVGDRHPSGAAHLRRSVSRQLTIVEPERYLEWYRAELAAQNDEIRRALSIENTASTRVKQLKAQEGPSK